MNSAARVIGRAAMGARAMRAAVLESEHDYQCARDELAAILRSEAVRVLSQNGIPPQSREDLAQSVTLSVLDRIVAGSVEPGFEDGYLAVAAKNRARDFHREASGVYERTDSYEEDFFASSGLDPHSALERAEEERGEKALIDQIVHVLHTAPARYREVLVAVYLEGTPIDFLVDREVERERESGANGKPYVDDTSIRARESSSVEDAILRRRRARARVDKLLQRARDWVRARVMAPRTTPPPAMNNDEATR
jgi:DNA-directed RNA polymerase specialized sigma24 family protein